MAASSPAQSNNSTDTASAATTLTVPTASPATASVATAVSNVIAASATSQDRSNPPKTLRGLNKPKCIKCGNVARSRCPYQSCKSCCSKAQNPCHIHVLKPNATFPDKTPASNSTLFEQQSPSATSLRVSSLRQLSNNFAQFSNVQVPLRSKKPLTRKEAAAINEWRFSKLKEYKDRNIEAEHEAFDRYMRNISLLEEVFSVGSMLEESTENESPVSKNNHTSLEDNSELFVSGLKLKLKSNPVRTDNFRKRLKEIVDEGIRKLQKCESNDYGSDLSDQNEVVKISKKSKSWWDERALAISDLIDKLNKARNEEDLKACSEMKSQLLNGCRGTTETETEEPKISEEQIAEKDLVPGQKSDFSPPKLFRPTEINQKMLNCVDEHFSNLEQIGNL